uniref:Uncharacterized protein n=1 Tax=Anguilla anguilla TaxID=7936 RepID=A0A0E9XTI9_ANGAN
MFHKLNKTGLMPYPLFLYVCQLKTMFLTGYLIKLIKINTHMHHLPGIRTLT